VVRGNLLEEPVDAIVNAANGQLAHGGGVAGLIARAAPIRKVRLCLRDQPVIDAVLRELRK
jgi:O-acetyl-ADP-ribose deacetylase (regulator of RNase III)